MKVSVIATVRNEEESISGMLHSLQEQTRAPDEIIICDGGSTDQTLPILHEWSARQTSLRVISSPGANISRGRNLAIAAASGSVIASTDAGVRLAPTWLQELVRPFTEASASAPAVALDVVSGFFLPDAHTLFETVVGATVLPDLQDILPDRFLPSSRSVAFTKAAWQRAGGYPEWLDYCEDLVFDFSLRRAGCRFSFAPEAIARFRPRSSLRSFSVQYYRYARGDGKADLWRKRHALRYAIYVAGPLAIALGLRYNILWLVVAAAAVAYCWRPYQRLWPCLKTWGVASRLYALALVPVIRLVGDVAKMLGYPVGVWWRLRHRAALPSLSEPEGDHTEGDVSC